MAQSEAHNETDIGLMSASVLKKKFPEKDLKKGFAKPTLAAKIKFFYNLMEKLGHLEGHPTKNNETAYEARDAANMIMTKAGIGIEDMNDSLQLYNKSICYAEPGNGSLLSIAYANRAEILFQWKEYNLCRQNITLAKAAGFPEKLIETLNEKDSRYLSMLNEPIVNSNQYHSKSTAGLPHSIKPQDLPKWKSYVLLPKPQVSSDKPIAAPKPDAGQSPMKPIAAMNIVDSVNHPMIKNVVPYYSYEKYRGRPGLSLKCNRNIPYAVQCLEIKYDSKHGQHIITNSDLRPGQIIVVENPFVHAMETEDELYRYTKCAHCYKENFLSLIPCPSCTTTMYCSEKCLNESKQYHDIECPISDFMIKFAWTNLLAIRLTLKAYFSFEHMKDLKEFCKTYDENDTKPAFHAAMSNKQKYMHIYGFERKKSKNQLEEYCKVAFLYHILIKKTKFGEMIKTTDDHNTLMELLYHNIQIANLKGIDCHQYKTFGISDFGFDKSETIYSRGIYQYSSIFSHSCDPNIAMVANGTKLTVYCCRPVKKGSQLFRSYGSIHYFQHNRSTRQQSLSERFSIKCKCEACMKNYPSHNENIPDGVLPREYHNIMGSFSFLDFEVENLKKYLEILEKFDHMSPCLVLNKTKSTVHRIMKLVYGDISTRLKTIFSHAASNSTMNSEYTAAMISAMNKDANGFLSKNFGR